MFALTMGAGMHTGFPNVCLTPAGPVPAPVPYPSISHSTPVTPAAYTVLMDCMPTLNKLSVGMVSEGDEPGVYMGVVSHLESGQTVYQVGCITIMADGMPVQRLTSVTGQNSLAVTPNTVGMCVAPSQCTVLTLG